MSPPGPRPTPTAKAALLGFPGKRARNLAEPQPPSSPTVPPSPDWIGDHGRAYWEQQAPIAHQAGLLTELDVAAFAAKAESWDTYRRATIALQSGFTHSTPNNGESPKPETAIRKQALADWIRLAIEFGMTPSARSRIRANPPTPHLNPVDAFRAQRPARPTLGERPVSPPTAPS
jgi:P27 family predicted phage terminase small subunit